MQTGARVGARPSLADIAAYTQRELARLPPPLRALGSARYPVEVSPALTAYAAEVRAADR